MNPLHAMLTFCGAAFAHATMHQETAQQITRVGSFELPCSVETAFPLFSPEGERNWVKGWDPRPVFPKKIAFKRDTVFRQGQGAEDAVWMIVDADWQTHKAEYVRLAPESHTAHIMVRIESLGPERSQVTVSYTVTAFGEHAASVLEVFSEKAYAAKMRDWEQRISRYLEVARHER